MEILKVSQSIIDRYDELLSQGVKLLTDEQIDEVIGTQEDMLKVLDSMVLQKKIYAERRLIASKEEEKCETIIRRTMDRLQLENYECEDGKIKKSINRRFEVDINKLPREYMQQNRGKIHSSICKDEKIEGVDVIEGYAKYSIR